MEYRSTVWDAQREHQETTLENVQRRAASFAANTYGGEKGSVAKALDQLKWESLEKRRKVAKQTFLSRTLNGQAAVPVPDYVKFQSYLKTRSSRPNKFIQLRPQSDTYKFSFWPSTSVNETVSPVTLKRRE